MTSRDRMSIAMRLGQPDRVPVMCQLAIGHYFLQSGVPPLDIWFSSEGFGDALIALQKRYRFDGILVNLPGRDPDWRRHARSIEQARGAIVIKWPNGWSTIFPPDDLPWVAREDGSRFRPPFDAVEPELLFYVEPHGIAGVACPYTAGFGGEPSNEFPPYQFDTIGYVVRHVSGVSVHSEVFSPFSQLMELAEHASVLMALLTDPAKVHACLERLAEGAATLASGQAQCGVDAILISSAFAGAGFISPAHYREFVLPYEKRVIDAVRAVSGVPVYTHTCGAIGDRLELIAETGTNGIDTLDPPPLGTVDIADAKRRTAGRLFLKGNVDPVNTVLLGTPEEVFQAARERVEAAAAGGGYILSTACAVPPAARPENVSMLAEAADTFGWYGERRQEP
ncbi:MAG: uroporphyrinogen decarboxylase family protein [Vicinamibacterales bacterium]